MEENKPCKNNPFRQYHISLLMVLAMSVFLFAIEQLGFGFFGLIIALLIVDKN